MTRIIPRRKGHFVIFLIVGIVLTLLLSYYTSYFAYELVYDTGCSSGMLSAANSNAKLVFTNFCTYETKCEAEGKVIKDGIYSGSLSYPDKYESYYRSYDAICDCSEEDILKAMRRLMGGSTEKRYGYFSVIVIKGKPVQSFWCSDEKLLYCTESLAKQYDNITSENENVSFYAGGAAAGGYPVYNTDYKTKPSKGYTASLPASIIFGDAVKAMAYAVIIFSPLLLLLAVSVLIHRFYTKDEYRQNAQAVFEAAKVYLSECRNVIPDRVYSGVLKARKTEPEICFNGSDEDISAFMSNIATDRSKSYYSIKIQNGVVAESRFSISRRLLKGAECGGIYADVSVYHDSSAM